MKLSVFYTLSAYCILSVVSTDRVYTISNEKLSCDSCFAINDLPLGNFSQIDRLHLQIHPGRHTLSKSDFLVFEHVHEVSVIGTVNETEIECTNGSGILFSSVSNVVMANLSLLSCGGFDASSSHGVSAVYLHLVSNFTLVNIAVLNSTATGILISNTYGVARIQNSVVSGSPMANIVCVWGNQHSKNATSFINFRIENSAIEHGGKLHSCKDGVTDLDLSGGINVILDKIEIAGSIHLNHVTFYKNSGCRGGNVNIMISKFTCTNNFLSITVADSLISHGRAHTGGGLALSGNYYSIGRSFIYGNSSCRHSLVISNTTIINNHALEKGGGIYLSAWVDESIHLVDIHVHSSILESNTVLKPSVPHSEHSFSGGGLDFHLIGSGHHCRNIPVLVIDQCLFQNNSAHSGAGLYIMAKYTSSSPYSDNCTRSVIIINSSDFLSNEADFGAGAMLSLHAFHADTIHLISISFSRFDNNIATLQASGMFIISVLDDSSFSIDLHNSSFTENRSEMSAQHGFPSTLSLLSITKLSMSNCIFYRNSGSAIRAVLSRLHILGFLNVSHNFAAVGSGMNLVSSHLEIDSTSVITFTQNHASEVGGAIYYTSNMQQVCFYDAPNDSAVFEFVNNSAVIGGDILYEHIRSQCTLTNSNSSLFTSPFHGISEAWSQGGGSQGGGSQGGSLIASDPQTVCMCKANGTYDCDSSVVSYAVIRGAPLVLSVALADGNGLAAPGYVSITSVNEELKLQKFIHSEWNSGHACSKITIPVSTRETSIQFLLSPENYYHSAANPMNLLLSFLPCPSGFETDTECECPPFANTSSQLQCSISDFTFTRLPNFWIGHDENDTVLFSNSCPFNYCKPGKLILHDLSNTSSVICRSGRSGVLCGRCSGTLSLTLGSGDCKHCSNNFIALILAFCALGILLLIIITMLNLTVTRGLVNGIIFYAAFLHLNRDSFFPNYDNSNFLVLFISWLNLDFGFNVCFYDGLTSYAKVWLQFLFPVYLYIIEIIVIVSSYRSSKLARVTGARKRVKIMSTVFLLGYMKLLRAVLAVFPYAKVQSPNSSEVRTVWLYDGSIEYYSGHHTPLFAVAELFLVTISIPYTFSLLFVQVLQRVPFLPCKVQLEGISDAHVGPFKPKFRFWLGLLLFSYTILVLLYNFTGGDKGINLTALVIVCSLLLLLQVLFGGVYKNKILNILEPLFCFNLVLLSAMYLQISNSNIGNNTITLYSLITAAFVLIVVILFYHLYTGICTVIIEQKKDWKILKRFTRSNNYRVLSEDVPFETGYENASTIIDNASEEENRLDSNGNIELVPADWLPTHYPVPMYREHPDLLKSESEVDLHSHSDTSEKSIPELTRIKSSYLVVNKKEEEANLMEYPNNILRSQRLSIDGSGDRTYVIEDNIEDGCTEAITSTEPVHIIDRVQSNIEASTNETSVVKSTRKSLSGVTSSSPSQLHATSDFSKFKQRKRLSLSKQIRKRPPTKRNRITLQSKRPQPGTNCYKCDPSFFLQTKIKTFKVDKSGGEHSISSQDVTITIPPSAIKEGHTSLDIEVGVLLNGPFVFPPNIRPISPILWICSRNKALLCKPIEITLPHFIGNLDGEESKLLGIQFMKASHYTPTLPDGTRRFTFDRIGTNSTTSFTSHFGKLKTLHFCFLCIAAPESRALYEHASYCLTRVDPIVWNLSRQKQEIYFIVSYFMKTCLKVSIATA